MLSVQKVSSGEREVKKRDKDTIVKVHGQERNSVRQKFVSWRHAR